MANPRKGVEFDELIVSRLTAMADASIPFRRDLPYGTSTRHAPVKFTGDKTIGLCVADDIPFGSLERVEPDGFVVVAWQGAIPYVGTATPDQAVVADGAGGVKDAATPTAGKGTVGTAASGRVIVFQ